MLRRLARVVPHRTRDWVSSWSGFTHTLPSLTDTSTCLVIGSFSVPSLPFTVATPPATSTVTPCGMETGFLPTRDMAFLLEHAAQHFAADVRRARVVLRHHAPRGRQDRNTEPVVVARKIRDLRIDPTARRGDAVDLADHRRAFMVLQLDRDLAARVGLVDGVVADIAFLLQHLKHVRAQARGRRGAARHARLLGIPDAGQHISQRIAQRHLSDPPYQLALTMPGIWPVDANCRSAIRDKRNLR